MTMPSTTAPHWVVSGRTHGEVLTVGVSMPGLEVVLLGVPSGFTPPEVEGWLHDLAGVAVETSRGDDRDRAIPPLLHHALTGLLFSQAELWSRLEGPRPCSAAFVATPDVCAFGWVGEASVQLLVGGVLMEPRWVLVRDEEGREAHATVFHPGQHVLLTLDYWPLGNDGSQAPASVEAEWAPEAPTADVVAVERQATAAELIHAMPEAVSPAVPSLVIEGLVLEQSEPSGLPAHLAAHDRPGLAPPDLTSEPVPTHGELANELHADERAALGEPLPVEASGEPLVESVDASAAETGVEPEAPSRAAHPVGRWLTRMLGWGKQPARPVESAPVLDSDATPLSSYDSLLSDAVAPDGHVLEQTNLALAPDEPNSIESLQPLEFVPEVSEFAAEYATEYETDFTPGQDVYVIEAVPDFEPAALADPASPAMSTEPAAVIAATIGLPMAGLAEVLGLAFAPPAAQPEPEPAPPEFTHADLLRALSEGPRAAVAETPSCEEPSCEAPAPESVNEIVEAPGAEMLRVDHEPVGVAEDFAIAPVPGMSAPPIIAPEPMLAPPMLRVQLTPYLPEAEPEVTPEVIVAPLAPSAPPALRIPEGPPVLHVSVPEPMLAPPMLRLSPANEPLAAPPVLRVEPQLVPPPVIVPTPPVSPLAPVAPLAGFAPTVSADESVPALVEDNQAAPPRLPWPAFEGLKLERRPWYRRPQVLGAIVLALFGAGWVLGALANPKSDEPNAFTRLLRAAGLGGARFEVALDSSPSGAWIAVDGVDAAKRTPARIEMKPGKHTITLTLPQLGAATVEVRGDKGEKIALSPSLNGTLEILPADANVPISVSVDSRPQGYAPITMESLAPGLHEVQFSGPGMAPWAQTVQVGVRKTAQLLARPMSAPGTGVLQVQASLNDDTGASPLSGAQVIVDGESRGVTPLSLELPRGPHSIRLTWHGETAAVQVIDLPGGNQRFATFTFGLDTPAPQISIPGASRTMSPTQTNMISAAFSGLTSREVREGWLHVRSSEGLWRRYAMTAVTGPGVTMMAAVFPPGVYDATGRTIWYVSAITAQGDEYFSEMQPAFLEGSRPVRAVKPAEPH